MIYADFSKNIEPLVMQAKCLRGFQQKYRTARNAGKMFTRISAKMLVRT